MDSNATDTFKADIVKIVHVSGSTVILRSYKNTFCAHSLQYSRGRVSRTDTENKLLNKVVIFVSLPKKTTLVAS